MGWWWALWIYLLIGALSFEWLKVQARKLEVEEYSEFVIVFGSAIASVLWPVVATAAVVAVIRQGPDA